LSWLKGFQPADPTLFFQSNKSGDPRWGERVRPWQPDLSLGGQCVLAGYPDDEGIQLNKGRTGARLAPDAIRSRLYKTSISQEQIQSQSQLYDFGNLDTSVSLEKRHELAADCVSSVLKEGARWIGLGGGHDYGYPDGAGFLKAQKPSTKYKPLVINFDAHLDVRPTDQGLSSGTPFYRLLTDDKLPPFDFIEIGIQRPCNSAEHVRWASDKGVQILFLEDLLLQGESILKVLASQLSELLITPRPTYISVDIDCFSTAFAMGASQSWPMGLSPMDILPLLQILKQRLDVQVLGIYEVSPPLDMDEATVKLACQIIHPFLTGNSP
jgi:formiminoglutamase